MSPSLKLQILLLKAVKCTWRETIYIFHTNAEAECISDKNMIELHLILPAVMFQQTDRNLLWATSGRDPWTDGKYSQSKNIQHFRSSTRATASLKSVNDEWINTFPNVIFTTLIFLFNLNPTGKQHFCFQFVQSQTRLWTQMRRRSRTSCENKMTYFFLCCFFQPEQISALLQRTPQPSASPG